MGGDQPISATATPTSELSLLTEGDQIYLEQFLYTEGMIPVCTTSLQLNFFSTSSHVIGDSFQHFALVFALSNLNKNR